MDVDRHADRALYLQLADVLRQDINKGRLQPGERLPSETDLIDRHGVSRGTVREAIGILRNEGVVLVEHGRGAFVRSDHDPALLHAAECPGDHNGIKATFEHQANEQGTAPSIRQIDRGRSQPPSSTHSEGPVIAGDTRHTKLLCFADGRPVMLADVWHPNGQADPPTGTGLTMDITARMPTREERRLLQLEDGAPVIVLTRTLLSGEAATEHAHCLLVAARHQLAISLDHRP